MAEVISVKFKDSGKPYYFDPKGEAFSKGDKVIVDTARGMVFGEVTQSNTDVPDETVIQPLREVVRRATEEDIRRDLENRRKEKDALATCERKVAEHQLDMKLVDVEYAFDGSKMLFYFTSDGRVVSEEVYLREQGKLPLKNNLIRQLVKSVLGQFRSAQTEPVCVSRDRSEQALGEVMSSIMQYAFLAGVIRRKSMSYRRLYINWYIGRKQKGFAAR